MIEVCVRRDGAGRIASIAAAGHAGWAQHGNDVVCAAVSTVLQSMWLGLEEVAKINVDVTDAPGLLEIALPTFGRDDAHVHAIVATATLALKRIASQYREHVRVIDEPERVDVCSR